jgi:hypothetical protein
VSVKETADTADASYCSPWGSLLNVLGSRQIDPSRSCVSGTSSKDPGRATGATNGTKITQQTVVLVVSYDFDVSTTNRKSMDQAT